MPKLFHRSPEPEATAPSVAFSTPPPASPVEVGLALRAAREVRGLTLDQVREATGVPRVDLEALERGRLELLHVEQAAVVGLWRYAELLGLDSGTLVGVVRAHWPRSALAVDALYNSPDGAGMPVARLTAGEDILSRIVPKAKALEQAASPLGLSEATRHQLSAGAASRLLTVAVLGPVSGARGARPAPASLAAVAPPATAAVGEGGGPDVPPPAGPAAAAQAPPAPQAPTAPVASQAAPPRAIATPVPVTPEAPTARQVVTVPPPPAAVPVPAGEARQRGRFGRLLHVLAERFGAEPGVLGAE